MKKLRVCEERRSGTGAWRGERGGVGCRGGGGGGAGGGGHAAHGTQPLEGSQAGKHIS